MYKLFHIQKLIDAAALLVKQQEALQLSIVHWEKNLEQAILGNQLSLGYDECECCNNWHMFADCAGCPISQYTGVPYCRNTPYTEIFNLDCNEERVPKKLVQKEIAFLKTLHRRAIENHNQVLVELQPILVSLHGKLPTGNV
jgi:hypothetical protein